MSVTNFGFHLHRADRGKQSVYCTRGAIKMKKKVPTNVNTARIVPASVLSSTSACQLWSLFALPSTLSSIAKNSTHETIVTVRSTSENCGMPRPSDDEIRSCQTPTHRNAPRIPIQLTHKIPSNLPLTLSEGDGSRPIP